MTKPKPWSMHPNRHHDVKQLLQEENIHFTFRNNTDFSGCTDSYDTSIMGRFFCRNRRCQTNGWSSKKIALTIRKYPGKQYNAVVYHQRCERCKTLANPTLDGTYAERIAYRLKKWSGLEVDAPYFSGQSNRPHQKDLCEGCKAGHCSALCIL